MKKLILILFLLFVVHSNYSQKIQINGNWTKTLKASNIYSAGLDYESFYESNLKQSRITITPIPNSKYNRSHMPFKVFVHKEDNEWHENLILEVKVSSNSHGNSTGTVYQAITNSTSLFFNTIGKRKNIPLQYKISGLSVTLPATNYSAEIVYTVLNL